MSLTTNTPVLEERIIGMPVIVRSNEDEPYWVGIFKGFSTNVNYPIVEGTSGKFEGKEMFCGGIVIPHSTHMENMLKAMSPQEQWAMLADLSLFIKFTYSPSRFARHRAGI